MILAVTTSTLRSPGDREKLLSELLALQLQARHEPGVIEYRISIDPRDPCNIHGLEIYRSREALEHHLNSRATRTALAAAGEIDTKLSLTRYEGDLRLVDLGHT